MSSIESTATEGFVTAINKLGDISLDTLSKTITSSSTKISDALKGMLTRALVSVNNTKDLFKVAGESLITKMSEGAGSKVKTLISSLSKSMSSCVEGIKLHKMNFYSAGTDLGAGLVNGINAKKPAAYSAGYALGQAAVQGEKDGQQSKSPSKATTKAGKWLGQGLVNGIKLMGTKVYNAGFDMGEKATSSIQGALGTALDMLNGNTEAQPTIRPVLDLSDIQAGAGSINSMFGMTPSVGVMANVNSISASMSRRSQNGGNSELVAELHKLRRDVSGLQTNSYTINGITYDDGSNISAAVQSLVHAAVRERRV
jgi:hypothetical protein